MVTDQTDLSATDSSPLGGILSNLDQLAQSAISTIGGSVVDSAATGLGSVVSGALSPAPDLTAKSATPGATSIVAAGSVALPILLIGGALVAFMLLKR